MLKMNSRYRKTFKNKVSSLENKVNFFIFTLNLKNIGIQQMHNITVFMNLKSI